MPYKSQAQRRLFHWLQAQGKLSPTTVKEYDAASKGKKLPEFVKRKKAFGGEVEAKTGTHCPACDFPLDSAPVALDAGEGCPRCGYGSAKDVPHKARGGTVHEGVPASHSGHGGEAMDVATYRAHGGEIKTNSAKEFLSEINSGIERIKRRERDKEDEIRKMRRNETRIFPDGSIPRETQGWFQDNRMALPPEKMTPEIARKIQDFAEKEARARPEYAEMWRKNTSGRMGDVKMADQYAHGGEICYECGHDHKGYAHGGMVTHCARCGSAMAEGGYIPLKAQGGLVGDMKEMYVREKDKGARLDDGKIRSFGRKFAQALKHARHK